MKNIVIVIGKFTVLLLLLNINLWGEAALTHSGFNSNSFQHKLGNYSIDTVTESGMKFSRISVDGYSTQLTEKDAPALPYETVSLALSTDGDISVKVDSISYNEISALPPIPSKGHLSRSIDPETVPVKMGKYYYSNTWYPKDPISSNTPFMIRDSRGVVIKVVPFQYNGALKKLRIIDEIFVTVTESGGTAIRSFSPKASPVFEEVKKERFLNYSTSTSRYTPLDDNDKMLIITNSSLREVPIFDEFIEWKKRKGLDVNVAIYPSETGGAGYTALKSFLQNEYNDNKMTYIMIVGDHQDVPSFILDYKSSHSLSIRDTFSGCDPVYSFLEGDDTYPDAFIGRLSLSSTAELNTVMNKIINYERYPEEGAGWYSHAVSFASNEGNPADYMWMNDSINPVLENYGYTKVSKIYQGLINNTKSKYVPIMSEGHSLINFMGHGGRYYIGFNDGELFATSGSNGALGMTNGSKLPFVNLVACQAGAFTYPDSGYAGDPYAFMCIAEAFLLAPNGGAIASTGSSPLMSWTPPQHAMVETNRLIAAEAHSSIGAYFHNGKMKMVDLNPGDNKTPYSWNLFGDPSTQLFSKSPQAMSATVPLSAASGEDILISGEDGALVTLYNGDLGIQESKIISGGVATFNLILPAEGKLYTTITKRNSVPVEKEINLGATATVENKIKFQKLIIGPYVNGKMNIIVPFNGHYSISLFSINGRELFSKEVKVKYSYKLNLPSTLAKGVYIGQVKGKGISKDIRFHIK